MHAQRCRPKGEGVAVIMNGCQVCCIDGQIITCHLIAARQLMVAQGDIITHLHLTAG